MMEKNLNDDKKTHPYESAGWLSFLTLWWLQPLISKGAKTPLEMHDLPGVPSDVQAEVVGKELQAIWDQEVAATERTNEQNRVGTKKRHPSFGWALVKCFGREWLRACFILLFYMFAQVVTPLTVQALLQVINEPDEYAKNPLLGIKSGGGVVAIFVGLLFLSALSVNTGFIYLSHLGTKMRAAVMYVVFRKSLRLSPTVTTGSHGEIVNLMSNDSERLFFCLLLSAMLAIAPMTIFFIGVLLVIEIGWAGLAGISLTLVFIPIQYYFGKAIATEKGKMLTATDSRVNITAEALSGIEVVKVYCWETHMSERIQNKRMEEMKRGRNVLLYFISNDSLLFVAPSLIALVIFVVHAFATDEGLTMVKVFTVLALLVPVRFPLIILPRALSALVQAMVSVKRISKFLYLSDIQKQIHDDKGPIIAIKDASFSWQDPKDDTISPESRTSVLRNLSFTCNRGDIIAVVGPVGGGKSSFLNGILGEISLVQGSVALNLKSTQINKLSAHSFMTRSETEGPIPRGAISYCSQEPWIQNATIRENILFQSAEAVTSIHANESFGTAIRAEEVDEALFKRVLEASQLKPDIKVLPNGLNTEIGDRGVNLSGGQKARVAIARALYRALSHEEIDLVLMDDCFSALDPHVGLKIFHRCLDFLKDKTVIIVLNSHMHLLEEHFDRIVAIENGAIVLDEPREEALKNPLLRKIAAMTAKETVKDEEEEYNVNKNNDDDEENGSMNVEEDMKNRGYEDIDSVASELEVVLAPPANEIDIVIASNEHRDQSAISQVSHGSEQVDGDGVLYKEEDRKRGQTSTKVYQTWLKAAVGGMWQGPVFLSLFILFVGAQILKVISEYWLAIWAEKEYSTAIGLSVYSGMTAAMIIFIQGRGMLFMFVAVRSSINLHNDLIRNILRAPVNTFFDVTPIGQILNRVSNDMDKIDQFLPETTLNFLTNIFQVLCAFVLCGMSNIYLLLVMIPLLGGFVWIGVFFARSSRELKRLEGVSRSPLFTNFGEVVSGISTIRAFALEDKLNVKNEALIDNNGRAFLIFWMAARWLALRLDLLISVLQSLVAIFALLWGEKLDPNLIALAIIYSMQLSGLLQFTVRLSVETDNAFTAVERLTHYSSEIPLEKQIEPDMTEGATSSIIKGISNWPNEGSIEFQNVSMRYRSHLPLVLKDVSFRIEGGEKVGLCGRTGSGKTSTLKAFFRLVDPLDGGCILIDGIDISKLGLKELRSRIGFIPQHPVLFSGSLRFNIDPWGVYSDEEIRKAMGQAHLGPLAENPKGLDFQIQEKGSNLSHGQRQLLSICRALLAKKKIIMLDEPTSNIDASTDEIIQKTLANEFKQETVITIAHRIKTIINSDKILVLDFGKVIEFDSPKNLIMNETSAFAALVRESNQQQSQ